MRHRFAVPVMTLLLLAVCGMAGARSKAGSGGGYSWAPQARVIETGDLEWAPHPFRFAPGRSVRYIDYEGGDDANPGTRARPWRHHPWDPAATGRADACKGVHTYVFKRGVIYRGVLIAEESGTANEPIQLTSDPNWGEGEALIQGSMRLEGGWVRGSAATAQGIPHPEQVWYRDIGAGFTPRLLWEVRDGQVLRIPLARTPNWRESNPDDPRSEWHVWKKVEIQAGPGGEHVPMAYDPENLTEARPDAYEGATLWTEYTHLMGTPYAMPMGKYNPTSHSVVVEPVWGVTSTTAARWIPSENSRYFLENLPRFLDAPGEWYYDAGGPHPGRLFVRLPDDANPNHAAVEVARELSLLRIFDQSHIAVSGLAFRFQNVWDWPARFYRDLEVETAAVMVVGNCRNIRVANCRFEHVARAVRGYALGPHDALDAVQITDNDIAHMDHQGVYIKDGKEYGMIHPPMGAVGRVTILRNRLYDIGARPDRGNSSHAIHLVGGQIVNVAGNIVDRCYGSGIHLYNAKDADLRDRPLIRTLVHHNKVTNSLLHTNDWGGIEIWQGGPAYVFNNISGNPGGYWHWRHVRDMKDPAKRDHTSARFGFAFYQDGQFKSYLFNNIAWGIENDLTSPRANTAAFQEVIGFLNAVFNNTAYKFGAGLRKQPDVAQRCFYMGNLLLDMSEVFISHNPLNRDAAFECSTLAYGGNVFHGAPRMFAKSAPKGVVFPTIDDYRGWLEQNKALAAQTGVVAAEAPLTNPEGRDFRPRDGSAAVDQGVKFFAPWGLRGVVGEWNFYLNRDDPSRIFGESFYFNDEYAHRGMYKAIPVHDLKAVHVTESDFVPGMLEDWTRGALRFDGNSVYCVYTHAEMTRAYQWNRAEGDAVHYDGARRRSVNMDTCNFLIEIVLRADRPGAMLIHKAGKNGYYLELDAEGRPRMTLVANGAGAYRCMASESIAGAGWKHLLAEVDRRSPNGVRIYIDGRDVTGPTEGAMPGASISLANESDFYVGRGPNGDYFSGALDFLRLAQGTLADADTTIAELRAWQFDGPFLRDFTGHAPTGARRDAGAIEYRRDQK